tara:strand:+ start:110921 stop:112219 length:1299 start_codon:yes stop_codon:yes gene_type:complete
LIKNKRIGLALSGGGYRATIYHLGTLKKLKELKLLDQVNVISTNSGGSITGAAFGLYGDNFENFEKIIRKGVKSSVIKGVVTSPLFLLLGVITFMFFLAIIYFLFTSIAWLSLLLFVFYFMAFLLFQFKIFPISSINERIYDKYFFHKKSLSDLSKNKTFAINATNVETGTLFTFSREKMNDSSYSHPKDKGKPIIFKHKDFPIARAVAASTCVPFVFSPVKIAKSFYVNKDDIERANPRLIDGGIYDNQGVHKIAFPNSTYSSDIIIVSDAGNELPFKNSYKNVLPLLIRTTDIFMNRIKNFQMIQLIYNKFNHKEIAYQSLGWDAENSLTEFINNIKNGFITKDVIIAHNILLSDIQNNKWDKIKEELSIKIQYDNIVKNLNSEKQTKIARSVSTNLTSLNDSQISALINHASIMTELHVKLYCPSLFKK